MSLLIKMIHKFRQLVFCLILLFPQVLLAQANLESEIGRYYKKHASKKASVIAYDATNDKTIFARNAEHPLKPASVLKILITNYALKELGPDHRFETSLLIAGHEDSRVKSLILKGGGDPNFRTEDLWVLLRRLKQYNIRTIDQLYLDGSVFDQVQTRSGNKAYQAANSGLAFNFNALRFTVCPGRMRGNASVVHDPFEYPINYKGSIKTSSGRSLFNIDEMGKHKFKLNGNIHHKAECQDFYRSVAEPSSYLAYVVEHYLHYLGIKFGGKVQYRRYPAPAKIVAQHESKALSQILADLNKFSSNFIAEQLLYLVGPTSSKTYSREEGLKNLSKYLVKKGFLADSFSLHDASGLSHSNRISAKILLDIILDSINNPSISAEFTGSLAVSGQTGTLRKRKYSNGLVLRGKTGTINGVDSLAGILESKQKKRYVFVIIQNEVRSGWESKQFEDQLIKLLYKN